MFLIESSRLLILVKIFVFIVIIFILFIFFIINHLDLPPPIHYPIFSFPLPPLRSSFFPNFESAPPHTALTLEPIKIQRPIQWQFALCTIIPKRHFFCIFRNPAPTTFEDYICGDDEVPPSFAADLKRRL
ncbi:hypothetical protein KCU85_g1979, partial [Aureobasidium melanogenum]